MKITKTQVRAVFVFMYYIAHPNTLLITGFAFVSKRDFYSTAVF